jgi:hypothetical protein
MIDSANEAPLSAEAGDFSLLRSEVNSVSHSLYSGYSPPRNKATGGLKLTKISNSVVKMHGAKTKLSRYLFGMVLN